MDRSKVENGMSLPILLHKPWGLATGQFPSCKTLHNLDLEKQEATAGRIDCVFFIPLLPFHNGCSRDFDDDGDDKLDLSLENAWYGRVSQLFSIKFRTDSGEVRDVDCAIIDIFLNYAEGGQVLCVYSAAHWCTLMYKCTQRCTE